MNALGISVGRQLHFPKAPESKMLISLPINYGQEFCTQSQPDIFRPQVCIHISSGWVDIFAQVQEPRNGHSSQENAEESREIRERGGHKFWPLI